MSAVRESKRGMIKGLIEMQKGVFKGSGAQLILGHGRLVDGQKVEVELKGWGYTDFNSGLYHYLHRFRSQDR